MFQQVVRSDEIEDGYGDGDRGDSARRAVLHPYHHSPTIPYYFILTASYSPNTDSNTQHHNAYHASHNAHDNHLDDNAHDNADKHGLHHAQAATTLSPL